MSRTRENLKCDFAASVAGRNGGGRMLLVAALVALLTSCSSINSVKNIWEAEDIVKVLPPDEPFSLRCGEVIEIIYFDTGPPDPQDNSSDHAQSIQDRPLVDLNFDGSRAVLDATNGKRTKWTAVWYPSDEYSAEMAKRIFFYPPEGRVKLFLELDNEYRGFAPLFLLTYSFVDSFGEYGTIRKISETFNCMRVADISARINP